MKNKITFLFVFAIGILSGQSVIDPDNIVVGADELPTETSSDSVFYFHKGTMSWRAGLFENGIAAPSIGRKWNAAWGRNNTINGDFSTGWGNVNRTNSLHGSVWGETNIVSGNYGTAWGKNNEIIKTYSTAWGFDNFINADYSTAWGRLNMITGKDLTSFGYSNTAFGQYNTVWGSHNSVTDTLSTAWGTENEATGSASTAWGAENKAIGRLSTVWGGESQAIGDLNTVWGIANSADSTGATAWGVLNKSLNYHATAWGRNNQALGIQSTVLGQGNGTRNTNAMVAGQFNEFSEGALIVDIDSPPLEITYTDEFGNEYTGEDFHQLFVVGNGTSTNSRSNAITVTKSGRLGVGVSLPASALNLKSNEELRFGPTASITGEDHTIITNSTLIPTSTSRNLGTSTNRWGRVYTVAGVVTTSDIRLKENIKPVSDALSKIEELSPIYYNLISNPKEIQIGFSAQELETLVPEAVYKEEYLKEDGTEDFHYGINYSEIIPILTKAIQEQQALIKAMQVEIKLLKEK